MEIATFKSEFIQADYDSAKNNSRLKAAGAVIN
jgi:hypothetical protein